MKQYVSKIISNKKLCSSMYQIDLDTGDNEIRPQPGQFLTARISRSISPVLRRPFAFSHYYDKTNKASFIYQLRGTGTAILSSLSVNTDIDIIAPLGKPFPLPAANKSALLVAGGIGLGPIVFLAETLNKLNINFQLIFGCRTADMLPSAVLDTTRTVVCTDDGSAGFKGSVVDYMKTVTVSSDTAIYSCGPHPMLRACHLFATARNLECFVSVEQVMACGVGACMGCAVKVHGPTPYVRACKEGPVFSSKDIVWE